MIGGVLTFEKKLKERFDSKLKRHQLVINTMEVAKKQRQFPLMELTMKLLKRVYCWNDAPGLRFPFIGYLIIGAYPIVWLIPSWLFIATSRHNITKLLKAVNEQIVFFTIFYKLYSFVKNFQQWEQLFYDIQRAFNTVHEDIDIQIQSILGHVVKSARFLTKNYFSVLLINCSLYGFVPMVFVVIKYAVTGSYDVPLAAPVESNYFIPGYQTNFWIWLPFDCFLSAILQIHGIVLFSVECFIWNLLHATACLFRILQVKAEQLGDSKPKGQSSKDIQNFIVLHDLVLRSAGKMEEILRGEMLFLYMSTIFALCLMMTVMSVAFKDVYLLIIMACVFGYCLFQTFAFSILGSELIEESTAVADAIFRSKWYTQDVKSQRDLGFILMRAQKPVKITAAKLFVVTRDSFTQVIRQAYTIFTLMSQFLDNTEI
ncbi:odorant receptor Or2-like [Anopheles nili]|uniref:odorant receptor Or2-like n=1 Tax=Anopheles nili TaxID=185578 RepID=UPI00237BC818|nr:odorant receptor Or2-like [Anopheles nili]